MLRTVAVRHERLVCDSLKRLTKNTAIRCFSFQCVRRLDRSSLTEIVPNVPKPTVWNAQVYRYYSSKYPKHNRITLPALSPTMETGTIVSWEKKVGDKLNEGDLLAEIETDKATMGFETPEEGYLAKILVEAGTKDVKIGKLVCIIVENAADVAAFKDYQDTGEPASAAKPAPAAAPSAPPPAAAPAAAAPPPAPAAPASAPQTAAEQRGPRIYASPMAKRLAETQKLRLEGKGSGLYGSITSKDLAGMKAGTADVVGLPGQKAKDGSPATAAAPPPPGAAPGASYHDVPVSNIRAVIAKRLLESKTTIPHFYVTLEVQIDQLTKVRAKFNKKFEKEGVKLTINDFIIKAVASSCRMVPEVNSSWMGSFIRMYNTVDCSVAVDIGKGLITPIIRDADRKGLIEISKEMKSLVVKAKEGKLKPHEFQGGGFSVSNLGMFGMSHFAGIINPPQSAILCVGGPQKRVIAVNASKNEWKESEWITVTLCADHRTVDGAVAARWLQHFQKCVEDPAAIIL